ncbi:hypothetical protein GCM10027037_29720 [Mucilaginibacter koreensis]
MSYMKTIAKRIYLMALMASAFTACKKNDYPIIPNNPVNGGAFTRFIYAVPGAPNVDVFLNDTKINGTALAYPVTFPNNNYSSAGAGTYTFKSVVNTPTPVPAAAPVIPFGTTLNSTALTLNEGAYYSIFITGQPTATTVNPLIVEDKLPVAASDKAYIRFVNAMPDGNAVDLTGGLVPSNASVPTTITTYFNNLAPRGVGNFIAVDAIPAGSQYQLTMKQTASQAVVGKTLSVSLIPGRIYTLWAYGFNTAYTIPNTTSRVAAGATLGVYVNR